MAALPVFLISLGGTFIRYTTKLAAESAAKRYGAKLVSEAATKGKKFINASSKKALKLFKEATETAKPKPKPKAKPKPKTLKGPASPKAKPKAKPLKGPAATRPVAKKSPSKLDTSKSPTKPKVTPKKSLKDKAGGSVAAGTVLTLASLPFTVKKDKSVKAENTSAKTDSGAKNYRPGTVPKSKGPTSRPKIDYNVGITAGQKKGVQGVSFKTAFRHFRNKGDKTFKWNGTTYTTKLEEKKREK